MTLPSPPLGRRTRAGLALVAAACAAILTHPATNAQQATGRQFQLVQDGKGYKLEMKTVARPTPGSRRILVRVRAVSLNQRDLSVSRGQYGGTGGGTMAGKVPLSDGAGEVVAVGPGATRFRVGDRVAGIFFARWIDGRRTADGMASARGGAGMDGMLSEFVAGDEDGFVRAMGAFGTVNYRTNPEWQKEVRKLTGDAGVDHVLEVGGRDTLPRALDARALDGHMAIIGGLSGFASDVPAGRLLGMGAKVTGIYVGSRADFEAMNRFMSEHKIRPVIDRVFPLEQAPQAFEFMDNGSYLGKIVIKL